MARSNGFSLDTNIVVSLVRDKAHGKYLERTYQLTSGYSQAYIPIVVVGESRSLSLKWCWGIALRTRLAATMRYFSPLDIDTEGVLDAYAAIDAGSAAS